MEDFHEVVIWIPHYWGMNSCTGATGPASGPAQIIHLGLIVQAQMHLGQIQALALRWGLGHSPNLAWAWPRTKCVSGPCSWIVTRLLSVPYYRHVLEVVVEKDVGGSNYVAKHDA